MLRIDWTGFATTKGRQVAMMKPGEWEDAYLVLLESFEEPCPCCGQSVARDPKIIPAEVLDHVRTRVRSVVEERAVRLELECGAQWHDIPGDLVVGWGVTTLTGDLLWFERFLSAPIPKGNTAQITP